MKGVAMKCGVRWRGNGLLVAGLVLMLFGSLLLSGCEKTKDGDKEAEQESTENQPKQMNFYDLFEINGDIVTPKFIIRYNSITMTPEVPFESQVMRFDNTPFKEFIGHDALVKKEGMVYRIIRFY
jgi:hypothetical protein